LNLLVMPFSMRLSRAACSSNFRRFQKVICRDCGPTWYARTACTGKRWRFRLGDYLLLGEGEQKSGGHRRPSILADALEALFGRSLVGRGL
jgi:hypothetical protein